MENSDIFARVCKISRRMAAWRLSYIRVVSHDETRDTDDDCDFDPFAAGPKNSAPLDKPSNRLKPDIWVDVYAGPTVRVLGVEINGRHKEALWYGTEEEELRKRRARKWTLCKNSGDVTKRVLQALDPRLQRLRAWGAEDDDHTLRKRVVAEIPYHTIYSKNK